MCGRRKGERRGGPKGSGKRGRGKSLGWGLRPAGGSHGHIDGGRQRDRRDNERATPDQHVAIGGVDLEIDGLTERRARARAEHAGRHICDDLAWIYTNFLAVMDFDVELRKICLGQLEVDHHAVDLVHAEGGDTQVAGIHVTGGDLDHDHIRGLIGSAPFVEREDSHRAPDNHNQPAQDADKDKGSFLIHAYFNIGILMP